MVNKNHENPFQALAEELEYLEENPILTNSKATKKSKEAMDADRQVFASIENDLLTKIGLRHKAQGLRSMYY